ncbi:MAG TPA: hypothetical protein VIW68_05105 [Candidatus Sulfotelmatobacter sp.]
MSQVPSSAMNPLTSGEAKKRAGLDFRVYQELYIFGNEAHRHH